MKALLNVACSCFISKQTSFTTFTLFLFACIVPIQAQWNSQNSSTDFGISSCYFLNQDTGWIVGNLGNIRMTTNGGTNWVSQVSGIDKKLNSIVFATQNIGWCVGNSGEIFKTINGGYNWSVQESWIYANLKSIHLLNEDDVTQDKGWRDEADDPEQIRRFPSRFYNLMSMHL